MSYSKCPSCREYEVTIITAPCGRRFYYCRNCDYGINECTEGECSHAKVPHTHGGTDAPECTRYGTQCGE